MVCYLLVCWKGHATSTKHIPAPSQKAMTLSIRRIIRYTQKSYRSVLDRFSELLWLMGKLLTMQWLTVYAPGFLSRVWFVG